MSVTGKQKHRCVLTPIFGDPCIPKVEPHFLSKLKQKKGTTFGFTGPQKRAPLGMNFPRFTCGRIGFAGCWTLPSQAVQYDYKSRAGHVIQVGRRTCAQVGWCGQRVPHAATRAHCTLVAFITNDADYTNQHVILNQHIQLAI